MLPDAGKGTRNLEMYVAGRVGTPFRLVPHGGMERPERAVRFARLIHRRVRVLSGSAARAACGGNLSLPRLPLNVVLQEVTLRCPGWLLPMPTWFCPGKWACTAKRLRTSDQRRSMTRRTTWPVAPWRLSVFWTDTRTLAACRLAAFVAVLSSHDGWCGGSSSAWMLAAPSSAMRTSAARTN